MKKFLFILVLLFISFDFAFGQDIIKLKTGDKIEAIILQIDENNLYYRKWNNENTQIQSLAKIKISEIIFEGVDYSKIDNSFILLKYENQTYKIELDTLTLAKQKDTTSLKPRKVSINLNIFPQIDYSMSLAPNDVLSFEAGLGPVYTYVGARMYLFNNKQKWKKYIGIYYYHSHLNDTKHINIPFGYELRKSRLKFSIELGIFASIKSISLLPKIGIGLRL